MTLEQKRHVTVLARLGQWTAAAQKLAEFEAILEVGESKWYHINGVRWFHGKDRDSVSKLADERFVERFLRLHDTRTT